MAIAMDLVKLHPVLGDPREEKLGYEIWYYNESGCSHPSGYLQEKLQNQRRQYSTSKAKVNTNSSIGLLGWTSDENEEVMSDSDILFLETNMAGEEVRERMRKTVFGRRNMIRTLETSEIRRKFPRLFDIEGMIIQDFNVRHPKLSDNLYKLWPRISKNLLQYCLQTRAFSLEKFGINLCPDSWSDDQYCIVGFMLLTFIFSKSGRSTIQSTSFKKRSKPGVRISQRDQLDSLVTFVVENVSILETMTDGVPIYPKLIVRGSLSNLSLLQSFVAVSEEVVPCGQSFITAIDTCYKSYFVLGIDFPSETKACWQFISYAVFNKQPSTKDPLLAPVRALAGQILPRST